MAGKVRTYNPKEVLISFGTHSVTGYAEDSFVSLEKNGDGISDVIGCDGEQIRSLDPDDTWNITRWVGDVPRYDQGPARRYAVQL